MSGEKEVYLGKKGSPESILEKHQKCLPDACFPLTEMVAIAFELWRRKAQQACHNPNDLPTLETTAHYWDQALVICLARSAGKSQIHSPPNNGLIRAADADEKGIKKILAERTPPEDEIHQLTHEAWKLRSGRGNSTEAEKQWDRCIAQMVWAVKEVQEATDL